MGVAQIKVGNLNYAFKVFTHANNMATKFKRPDPNENQEEEKMNSSVISDRVRKAKTDEGYRGSNKQINTSVFDYPENNLEEEDSDYIILAHKINKYLTKVEKMLTNNSPYYHSQSVQTPIDRVGINNGNNAMVINRNKKRKIFVRNQNNEGSQRVNHNQSQTNQSQQNDSISRVGL